jgi:hypothetical protein
MSSPVMMKIDCDYYCYPATGAVDWCPMRNETTATATEFKRMVTVTFLRQPYDPFRRDYFSPTWETKREPVLEMLLELPVGKHWEYLAEKMFHLTNAPEECLSEEDQEIMENVNYRGPCVSVGDVVRVEYGLVLEEFLCLPCGWEQK